MTKDFIKRANAMIEEAAEMMYKDFEPTFEGAHDLTKMIEQGTADIATFSIRFGITENVAASREIAAIIGTYKAAGKVMHRLLTEIELDQEWEERMID